MGLLDTILFGILVDSNKNKKRKSFFDTEPLDKKYPDAFDDNFGKEYNDNGFNKFDDEED
ncbi:MAG: hypothetical protein MJZ71_01120 [Bacteroidales bacterium]|nr:hypothetical protein [Bacteroidales bacterium]